MRRGVNVSRPRRIRWRTVRPCLVEPRSSRRHSSRRSSMTWGASRGMGCRLVDSDAMAALGASSSRTLRSSSNPSWEFGARSDHEAGRDSHAANPVESLSCCMTLRKSAIWFQLGMVRPCRAPCSMAFSTSPGPSSAGGAIVAASSQSLTTAAGDGF